MCARREEGCRPYTPHALFTSQSPVCSRAPRSYLVLPFCKWTLKSYFEPLIAARVAGGSQLMEEREVLLLLLQLCRALTHLQRHHVVHRDMKVVSERRGGGRRRSLVLLYMYAIGLLTHGGVVGVWLVCLDGQCGH